MESRVIYLGRLPQEFQEPAMRSYFEQFGRVTRLRLARNPRTRASRHYGFVEFESPAVARIVAHAMHNYLLSGHLLQCRIVPVAKIHERMFKGVRDAGRDVNRRKYTAWMTSDEPNTRVSAINERHAKRLAAKREKLASLGFELPKATPISIKAVVDAALKEKDAEKQARGHLEDWEVEYAEEIALLKKDQ